MKRSRTQILGILIGVLVTLAVVGLQYIGAFDTFELRAYDLRFKIRGEEPPPEDILLVTIDETTRRVLNKRVTQLKAKRKLGAVGEIKKRRHVTSICPLFFKC